MDGHRSSHRCGVSIIELIGQLAIIPARLLVFILHYVFYASEHNYLSLKLTL